MGTAAISCASCQKAESADQIASSGSSSRSGISQSKTSGGVPSRSKSKSDLEINKSKGHGGGLSRSKSKLDIEQSKTDLVDDAELRDFRAALMKKYPKISEAFAAFDVDGDGCVNREEFEKQVMSLEISQLLELRKTDLAKIFDKLDTDGSGSISQEEFRTCLKIVAKTKSSANVDCVKRAPSGHSLGVRSKSKNRPSSATKTSVSALGDGRSSAHEGASPVYSEPVSGHEQKRTSDISSDDSDENHTSETKKVRFQSAKAPERRPSVTSTLSRKSTASSLGGERPSDEDSSATSETGSGSERRISWSPSTLEALEANSNAECKKVQSGNRRSDRSSSLLRRKSTSRLA